MSRLIIPIIAVALVIGGLVWLSKSAKQVPTQTIETDVSQGAH